jgi:competence protein ComEA
MKYWLNKHFGFSKSEFNGLIALIILISITVFSPTIYKYFSPIEDDELDMSKTIQKINLSNIAYAKTNYSSPTYTSNKKISTLFKFDPNQLDQKGWEALGLSPKQASSIINYRNKGGKFFKPEDLKKMYTISPEVYAKILPYVEIDKESLTSGGNTYKPYEKKEYIKKAPVIVEINQADSAQLDQIKGIGPAFANRIIKYRDRLGGFYSKEQLKEVYGLDSLKYEEIKDQIIVDAGNLKKTNINTATFNDLKTCPYLSYKQMNAIIQYRKQHGNFNSINDLKNIVILNPQILAKISPYINF